ncbi:hypothetical protein DEU33_0771 [Kocuria sp. AG109]|nr:hypothetical protein DEU33_0771 [Kocuria sp. AG109]
MHPNGDRLTPLLLSLVRTSIQALLSQDPLVPFHLPVVPRGVGADPLMTRSRDFNGTGEVLRAVIVPVIGHDPHDPGDAVGGEEHHRTGSRTRSSCRPLVLQRFGVDQARGPIDDRVQVGVPTFRLIPRFEARPRSLPGPWALQPPPSGSSPDLLHVQVDHASRVAGSDLPRLPQGLITRGDVLDPIQPQPVQPPGRSPHAAADPVGGGQLMRDPTGGPLALSSPLLDDLRSPCEGAWGRWNGPSAPSGRRSG